RVELLIIDDKKRDGIEYLGVCIAYVLNNWSLIAEVQIPGDQFKNSLWTIYVASRFYGEVCGLKEFSDFLERKFGVDNMETRFRIRSSLLSATTISMIEPYRPKKELIESYMETFTSTPDLGSPPPPDVSSFGRDGAAASSSSSGKSFVARINAVNPPREAIKLPEGTSKNVK
ncbi:MAG: hypothetical protein OK454_05955, partial [Thaumarchaeota archaeon]|nr:hypothetical protein [Nitrososphaerota archaeon]